MEELTFGLARPLLDLVRSCEVHCVAACCGIDAYEFRAETMAPFAASRGKAECVQVLDQIEGLLCQVGRHGGPIRLEVPKLELHHVWQTAGPCLALLLHWQREFLRALTALTEMVVVPSEWLRNNGRAVASLARTIRTEEAFDLLPVLADALEEAGCDDAILVGHCRKPHDHERACWVVELLDGAFARPRAAPTFVVDGRAFHTLVECYDVLRFTLFSGGVYDLNTLAEALEGPWEGEPEELVWEHSELSRSRLGHEETARHLEERLANCASEEWQAISEALDRARRGEGPTVWDEIVALLEGHPGRLRLRLR